MGRWGQGARPDKVRFPPPPPPGSPRGLRALLEVLRTAGLGNQPGSLSSSRSDTGKPTPLQPSSREPRVPSLRDDTHTAHGIVPSIRVPSSLEQFRGRRRRSASPTVACGGAGPGRRDQPLPSPTRPPPIFLLRPVPPPRRVTAANVTAATVTRYVGTRPFQTETQAHVEAGREVPLRAFTLPGIWGCTGARPECGVIPPLIQAAPRTPAPPPPSSPSPHQASQLPVHRSPCGRCQAGSPSRGKVRKSEDLGGEAIKRTEHSKDRRGDENSRPEEGKRPQEITLQEPHQCRPRRLRPARRVRT